MSSDGPKKSKLKLWLALAIVIFGAAALAATGVMDRRKKDTGLATWTKAQAVPTVDVISAEQGSGSQELNLPGNVAAFYEAQIHAQVSGYVKNWYEDIGAHVKAGQLLAEIDTPELDQELEQVKGQLAKAQADLNFAVVTAKRWKALRGSDAVSQQTADEKAAEAASKQADFSAAEANVARINAMEGFKRIIAPFDGVVTARSVDIGSLVNAGSGAQQDLFHVADISKMRIYVPVPQQLTAQLYVGMKAKLKLPQFPDKLFDAKMVTTSNSISENSRTLLVELDADNKQGLLWPGAFAEVHFQLREDPNVVRLATSALLFRRNHAEVATVGEDSKVVLKPIEIGRDLGTQVEVTAGITASDQIIDSPSDSIANGDVVKISDKTQPLTKSASDTSQGKVE
jgi:RND family efflux transporter MFP subunit